ncbi:NAD(P)-dependent dehydrogenase (short-subunit alcohol dehydrogenase family) [Bradyrhizobium sp. GM0.4]
MDGGYYDEACAWRDWLIRAVAGSPDQLQIMYSVTGERRLTEWEVPWPSGYENSKPVRIGNAAHQQLQLDVYRELMGALYQARRGGLAENKRAWAVQCALLDHLKAIWTEPDEGIWEVRGGRKQFTYSKIMASVAFDRAIKSAKEFGMEGPVDDWTAVRDAIHADVCRRGYDEDRKSFVQVYGEPQLDASLLLIPAVERDPVADGFVRRYHTGATKDGLPPGEGMFLACSFWLADAYQLIGRGADANALFERLLSLRNDVGLLSEEYDVSKRRLVGNFPQAFSHIALVNTAHNLTHRDKPSEKDGAERSRCERRSAEHDVEEPSMPETMTDLAGPAPPGARQRPAVRFPVVLEGQPALVTGANSGIGQAVALGIAASGADVVVNYVADPAAAEEVAHQIESGGRRAIAIKADVSREDEVNSMFAQAVDHFGTLHIAVNNAGLQRDASFDEMTLEQWKKVIDVNLTGQFLCAREAVREFKKRGVVSQVSAAAGKLVFMSSVHQEIPWAGHVNYAASKGGVMQLMRSIAQEVAPFAIRANGVAPGAIRTPINRPAWETPDSYERLMTLVPYKRIGEPDDIAQAVAWLVSDMADYVTGATLFVDGGMSLYPGFATGG